jgi:Arc/MetJ family transcription regulator
MFVAKFCRLWQLASLDFRSFILRVTLNLDDDLVASAQSLTGLQEKSSLIHEALKQLIEREAGRRLARLGGSEPQAKAAPRRRSRLK